MKINICLIFCFLISYIQCYLNEGSLLTRATRRLLGPDYMSYFLSLSDKTLTRPFDYKVTIYVIKDTDSVNDVPREIKTTINFKLDTLDLVKNKKVLRSIPYSE